MHFDIDYQITEALPSLVAGAAVMDIAERALSGMGTGIIDRQQEQGEPWVRGELVLPCFGLMEHRVIDRYGEAGGLGGWRACIEGSTLLSERCVDLTWLQTVVPRSSSQIECPGQIMLLMLARRHDLQLSAWRHPCRADAFPIASPSCSCSSTQRRITTRYGVPAGSRTAHCSAANSLACAFRGNADEAAL